jgi:hypothetical protein
VAVTAKARTASTISIMQIKGPKASVWTTLTTTPRTQIVWTAGAGAQTGVYSFRARLKNPETGASSGWSPVHTIAIS